MDFTLQELCKLKLCVSVYHSDCDRNLRRVRRNRQRINDWYNQMSKEKRESFGTESAEQQIDNYVTMKKEAIILSKKLEIAIKEMKND